MTDRPDTSNNDIAGDNANLSGDAAAAISQTARPSVVNIVAHYYHGNTEVAGSAGSGAFLRSASDTALPRCEVVTDNHALGSSDLAEDPDLRVEYKVKLDDGTTKAATLIKRDYAHDLAFLKLVDVADPARTCKTLVLADTPPVPGEATVRVNRTMQQLEFNVGNYNGTIKRSERSYLPPLPGENMDRPFLALGAHQSPGHQYSGSPVLNLDNKVIGIHEAAGATSNESLATPAQIVKEQLDQLHATDK